MRGACPATAVLAVVVATLLSPPTVSGYTFLLVENGGGVSRRWDFGDSEPRIPWFLATPSPDNVSGERALSEVARSAFDHWEQVVESRVSFAFRGTTGPQDRNASDRRNVVTFADPGVLGSSVLGATFLTSGPDGRITDADVVLSRGVPFSTRRDAVAGEFDVESVLTHEIGHLIGLDHSGLVRATMAPFTDRGDVHQRSLETDDGIGAGLLYPADGFPGGRGSLAGRVTLDGLEVFLAHVVASTVHGRAVASGYTRPDGTYRIDGLPPDVYVVHAERLDGPVRPSNVAAFRQGFGQAETMDYETTFH